MFDPLLTLFDPFSVHFYSFRQIRGALWGRFWPFFFRFLWDFLEFFWGTPVTFLAIFGPFLAILAIFGPFLDHFLTPEKSFFFDHFGSKKSQK